MNNRIIQDIIFREISCSNSLNHGTCSVEGCSSWGAHYALINLNDSKVSVSFCKKNTDEIKKDLYITMSKPSYSDGSCAEEHCDNPVTKSGTIKINGLQVSIAVCEIHGKQIGNVLLQDNEVIKIPTFKCIPRVDFEGGMMFFCPYCQKWHKHAEGDGHRVAHCDSQESPLLKTGYYIELMQYEEITEVRESIESYFDDYLIVP
ncbi:MAG: hypothetical protein R2741_15420 [Methanolobus sp.]